VRGRTIQKRKNESVGPGVRVFRWRPIRCYTRRKKRGSEPNRTKMIISRKKKRVKDYNFWDVDKKWIRNKHMTNEKKGPQTAGANPATRMSRRR